MSKPTLYHYVHCPYCIRVRMAFGFLGIPYQSKVLSYDDEATPLKLTGLKMLPILESATLTTNESLDIIKHYDENNRLALAQIGQGEMKRLEETLSRLSVSVHSLAMPYWVYSKEFTPAAREYFEKKKSVKRGPFNLLMQNRAQFEKTILHDLKQLENELIPFYESTHLSIKDIMLASQVWGLYVVPEFTFSSKWHDYLQEVKKQCHFNYHEDYWTTL